VKYEDLLEDCLAAIRRGEEPERLIAAHPGHAAQLRLDLATAGSVRGVVRELPAPSDARARQRLRADLAAQREAVAGRRSFFGRLRLMPAPALAVIAVAVIALVATLAVVTMPGNTAEASIEGVVIENDGATLTLQTESGVQSIGLDEAGSVSNQSGASVTLESLEPGQLLRVRGKERDDGELLARRIELRNTEELPVWCERFADVCAQLEKVIAERVAECLRDGPSCEGLRSRYELLRERVNFVERLRDLRDRCESGTAPACREVQQTCESGRPVCVPLREWLREHRPEGRQR